MRIFLENDLKDNKKIDATLSPAGKQGRCTKIPLSERTVCGLRILSGIQGFVRKWAALRLDTSRKGSWKANDER
jgi:hypothetical protein